MLRIRSATFAAMVFSWFLLPSNQAGLVSTYEAPGVQSSSAVNTVSINFDTVSNGWHDSQTYNPAASLSVTYVGNQFIDQANQFGGAGGTGNYFAVQANNEVTATLSAPQAYFGLWFSAADYANEIDFYNGSTLVGTFKGNGPEFTALSDSYLGNPNSPFLGQDNGEKFVFVNIYAQTTSDMFDKIVFKNGPGGTEFESDNHTFSATLQAPSAVPEPSTMASSGIAFMILASRWLRKRRRESGSVRV